RVRGPRADRPGDRRHGAALLRLALGGGRSGDRALAARPDRGRRRRALLSPPRGLVSLPLQPRARAPPAALPGPDGRLVPPDPARRSLSALLPDGRLRRARLDLLSVAKPPPVGASPCRGAARSRRGRGALRGVPGGARPGDRP